MTVSDKSAAIGGGRTHAHRYRGRAHVKKQKIKSIPRTRKEKCQTADRWQHLCAWRGLKALHACQFKWCFGPFSLGLSGRHRVARLTFLTAPCQKCQTKGRDCLQRCCRDPPQHDPTSEHTKSLT
jgi:hypothetical protein